MVQPKNHKSAKLERIEFAQVSGSRIVPHNAGEPFTPYNSRDLGYFQGRDVPKHIADLCHELSRRGPHGVHLSKVDHDDLTEMSLLGLPHRLNDWDRSNTWAPSALCRRRRSVSISSR